MSTLRKWHLFTLLILFLGLALTACGSSSGGSSGPITIRFYGNIPAWPSNSAMIQAVQDHFKGKYNIQFINVDWNNLDTVIKTGIISGNPADIYFYWPAAAKTYVDQHEVLDLTPYLQANNNAWMNTFNPRDLGQGQFNGKYFDVPSDEVSTTIIVNEDLAQKLGVTIPTHMSWDQFMSINQQIQARAGNGIYPFAIESGWIPWLPRNALISLANDENKLDAYANGQLLATDPIYAKALENTGALYKDNYVFPGGKAALTETPDQVNAGFEQGKIVMKAEIYSLTQTDENFAKSGGFKIAAVDWPHMGSQSIILGGCDGFFIPVNTHHPQQAAEVLQYYLSKDVQLIDAKYGLIPSNAAAQSAVTDPLLKSVVQNGGTVHPGEVAGLTPQISLYFQNNLLQDYVLGESASADLAKLNQLIQQAKK
jgi:ABC-type glycerol-3-phosphate transport system substrate-binding protein